MLRALQLPRGSRLFLQGAFGQMTFEVPDDLQGGGAPVEIVALPEPTGSLTVRLDPPMPLAAGKFLLVLRELRPGPVRRWSASRSYRVQELPTSGSWTLTDIVVGDYVCELRVGAHVVASTTVSVREGLSVARIQT